MPTIRVANRNTQFDYEQNASLLSAALAAGQPWRSFCGGSALCGTCGVVVIEGELAAPRPREQVFMDGWGHEPGYRLACQARLNGADVTVVNCSDAGFDPHRIHAACEAAHAEVQAHAHAHAKETP
ncbi:MAG: ferredoxin [Rhizobacter sp.]|nr:ferredoxin [Rhizobacter sp.]